jgi:hypothetical protein
LISTLSEKNRSQLKKWAKQLAVNKADIMEHDLLSFIIALASYACLGLIVYFYIFYVHNIHIISMTKEKD